MSIPITIRECERIGRVYYLLASGHYHGEEIIGRLEQVEFYSDALDWFERAYVYSGSEFSLRYTEICKKRIQELRNEERTVPALRVVTCGVVSDER